MNAVSAKQQQPDKDWDDIIPEAERSKFEAEERQKEEMEIMMLPRSRTQKANKQGLGGAQSDSGDDYDPNAKGGSGSEDSDAERPKRRGRPSKTAGGKESVKGFSEKEVRSFIKSFKKFANPMKRLEAIALDAELQEKPLPDLQRLGNELMQGCENALNAPKEEEDAATGEWVLYNSFGEVGIVKTSDSNRND